MKNKIITMYIVITKGGRKVAVKPTMDRPDCWNYPYGSVCDDCNEYKNYLQSLLPAYEIPDFQHLPDGSELTGVREQHQIPNCELDGTIIKWENVSDIGLSQRIVLVPIEDDEHIKKGIEVWNEMKNKYPLKQVAICEICGKSINETGTAYNNKPVHIGCYHIYQPQPEQAGQAIKYKYENIKEYLESYGDYILRNKWNLPDEFIANNPQPEQARKVSLLQRFPIEQVWDENTNCWIYVNDEFNISGYGKTKEEAADMFRVCVNEALVFKPKQADKPPLGVMPEWLWVDKRITALREAIDRYKEAGEQIPQEWINELYKAAEALKE